MLVYERLRFTFFLRVFLSVGIPLTKGYVSGFSSVPEKKERCLCFVCACVRVCILRLCDNEKALIIR